MVFRSKDSYVDILKRKGISVIYEPPLSKELRMEHFKIVSEFQRSGKIYNMWDNVGTHIDSMFNHQMAFYEYLKKEKFDMIITEQMQY